MIVRRLAHLLRLLLGGVVLGVAAVVLPKARPDDHWSTSPKVQMVEEASSESSGGPPVRRG